MGAATSGTAVFESVALVLGAEAAAALALGAALDANFDALLARSDEACSSGVGAALPLRHEVLKALLPIRPRKHTFRE